MLADYTPMASEALKLIVTVAAAWGSVKASLNGARADITEIKSDVKDIGKTLQKHGEDIAVLKEQANQERALQAVDRAGAA